MPMCIAALQNQAKRTIPTNEIDCSVPGGGVRSAHTSVVPSLPSVTTAQARKIRNIHGAE